MAYKYKDWTLFKREIHFKGGKVVPIYFFSKTKPPVSVPCDLPDGYIVDFKRESPHLIKKDEYDHN